MNGRVRGICIALILAAASGCVGAPCRVDGIIVPDPAEYPQVGEALSMLREGEPVLYGLLKKHVKKIDISLIYGMSYPFYDYLYLSRAALDRGAGYTASVVGHELFHVVINGVRRKVAPPEEVSLLGFPGLNGGAFRPW